MDRCGGRFVGGFHFGIGTCHHAARLAFVKPTQNRGTLTGNGEVSCCKASLAAAWSHIFALLRDAATPKSLLLAAIGAVASIHPAEARSVLVDLAYSVPDEEDDEGSEWIN